MGIPEYCERPACTTPVLDPEGRLLQCADWCILPELAMVWGRGIHTVCSCCGHGQDERGYIRVEARDAQTMREMGYEEFEPHPCPIHPGTTAFRAKMVASVRAVSPPETKPDEAQLDTEMIRRLWREASGQEREMIADV